MMKSPQAGSAMRDAFPVLRLDYNLRLIDANAIALPILNEWGCRKGSLMPGAILKAHPELVQAQESNQATECSIKFKDLVLRFDLIPFPEAGYIGLYGYHIEPLVAEKAAVSKKMAS